MPATDITTEDLALRQAKLEAERTRLERDKLEFEQKKMQRITVAVSVVALLVSSLQVAVAYLQSRLATAQTVEKFIPHLQRPETRDAALLTMTAFLEAPLVTQIASNLRATSVLETLGTRGSEEAKTQATAALSALDQRRRALVEQLYDDDKALRQRATTELVRQWASDAKLVPTVLEIAGPRWQQATGSYNAMVVLREAPPEALRANASELQAFLDKARGNGTQSATLATQVGERLSARPEQQRLAAAS
jgi:hypothetical protein